jgi:hypothetical protein
MRSLVDQKMTNRCVRRLEKQSKPSDLQGLPVELAGLESATSWVRSS